jgi:CheY-like chemotaxis protein
VVHGILKSHNGSISVQSKLNKGTTFQILLPQIESVVQPEEEDYQPLPMGTECILLVDDEEILVDLGKQMLERLGYQVVSRTSSIEALEAFRANPKKFNLVITDMTMPNMTGETLSKKILAVRPDIPILLCTSFSETISPDKANALGIRNYIMKPLALSDLAVHIRKALDMTN